MARHAVGGRIIKRIGGNYGSSMEVGGEDEGVPGDPVHGSHGLGFSAGHQSPQVVLRFIKLSGEVPVEINIVGVVPPTPVVVAGALQ